MGNSRQRYREKRKAQRIAGGLIKSEKGEYCRHKLDNVKGSVPYSLWGAKVVDRLAADLCREFPEMKGFSSRNLKYMRLFAETWTDGQFVQQVVAQIPWGHNLKILTKVKSVEEREWYALPGDRCGTKGFEAFWVKPKES